MKLDVFLRTNDSCNVHTGAERYCRLSKFELALGCTKSLVRSLNQFADQAQLIVFDDHSSQDFLDELHLILDKLKFKYQLINLTQQGNNFSCMTQFNFCKNSNADLVYSVEDDYLHCETAIVEMVESYKIFSYKLQNEVCIFPFDSIEEYEPPYLEPNYIVRGSDRHWRTGRHTTGTFMVSPFVFRTYWQYFHDLAAYYVPWQDRVSGIKYLDEHETISKVWASHVRRFSPIPGLALHMQFEQHRDPLINWQHWWKEYAR